MPGLDKLAINQVTTRDQWTLREAIEGYARQGVRGISVWRDKLAECGIGDAVALLDDHGMTVTGLCRGGMFALADRTAWQATIDDNLRAIEEAATIGARALILVAGGLAEGSKDLPGARARVAEGIAEILPAARAAGVPLAIEPMHPMTCSARGCVDHAQARQRSLRPAGRRRRRRGRCLPCLVGPCARRGDRAGGRTHPRLPRQ